MGQNKLLLMAENILLNLGGYKENLQKEKVVEHIDQFWTPQMKKELLEYFIKKPSNFSENLSQVMLSLTKS